MKKDLKFNIVLSDKDKETLRLVIFIVVIVIDVVIIFVWQRGLVARYFKESNQIKESITTLNNDITNLATYKHELRDLDSKINDLKLFITEESDVSALVENISNLANSCGVNIIQIKPTVREDLDSGIISAKGEMFGEVEIQIVAKSGFHQIGNFVSKIESSRNFFRLSSLKMENDTKDYMIQNINLSLKSVIKIKEKEDKKDSGKVSKRN